MASGRRIKEGILRRYKTKLIGTKWSECKAVLYEDSTLVWYEDQNESSQLGSIQLKQVAPFFAVGVYTTRMPNRPQLPQGAKVDHVLAFGTGPSKDAKVHWFLCANDEDMNGWMSSIVSTLPPPPQQQQPPQQQPQPFPPLQQAMPPPTYNQGPPQAAPYYNQPGGYNSAPQGTWAPAGYYPGAPAPAPAPTTVVMAPSAYPASGGGGLSSGWGTAAGLGGGMLAGGLMGYALGSMTHSGGGGGWGSGYGYGGGPGPVYDNDTTIINNYNVTNTTDNDGNNGGFDYGGDSSFDYGGSTERADDDGDFDFGGGDFE